MSFLYLFTWIGFRDDISTVSDLLSVEKEVFGAFVGKWVFQSTKLEEEDELNKKIEPRLNY